MLRSSAIRCIRRFWHEFFTRFLQFVGIHQDRRAFGESHLNPDLIRVVFDIEQVTEAFT